MRLHADVAVIGGGIVGLAHAWAAARKGLSVVLFERDRVAQGASVRNFGMVWPIGQPPGESHDRAMRSRVRWDELLQHGAIEADPCGSLHLAYRPDECAVIEEFAARRDEFGFDVAMLTPAEVARQYSSVNQNGLLGGMFSPSEMCVDPRAVIARLPHYLRERFGVHLRYGVAVRDVELPRLTTSDGEAWTAERVVVCSGVDFQTLYPEAFRESGVRRCKLQMMRTGRQPGGFRVGTMLAGGLTLCHYRAFEACDALAALKGRIAAEMPEYVRLGVHVMLSQNPQGECVIGDSHEYDEAITPFDSPAIDEMILTYLRGMIDLPAWDIAERWNGVYAKHPTLPIFTAEPEPGAHVVVAPGGAGMTMSFGFADDHWEKWK